MTRGERVGHLSLQAIAQAPRNPVPHLDPGGIYYPNEIGPIGGQIARIQTQDQTAGGADMW